MGNKTWGVKSRNYISSKELENLALNYSEFISDILASKQLGELFEIDCKGRSISIVRGTISQVIKNKAIGVKLKTKVIDNQLWGMIVKRE